MHSINVKCEVEADPRESIRFSWTYNNTRNVSPVSLYTFYILFTLWGCYVIICYKVLFKCGIEFTHCK